MAEDVKSQVVRISSLIESSGHRVERDESLPHGHGPPGSRRDGPTISPSYTCNIEVIELSTTTGRCRALLNSPFYECLRIGITSVLRLRLRLDDRENCSRLH